MSIRQARLSAEVDVRHATTGDADGIVALFDRVYHGGYHMPECADAALVRRTVASGDHVWVLALAAGAVVGSVMARHDPGNGSYELGRAAIDQEYRGRADVGAALDVLLRDTVRRPDCELLYGNVRSERARRKFGGDPMGWAWTGADGGMHVLHGEREEHLFGMAFNPERPVTRIVPHRSVLLPGSAVSSAIERLRSVVRTGAYPVRICAPGASGHSHESGNGRVAFSVFEPSRAAIVTAVEADTPGDVRRLLWELVEGAAPSKVEHCTVHVLADKLPLIEELCRPDHADSARRFAVRGYLPGWYKDGASRYDCVTLTAHAGEQIPNRFGLDALIEGVYRSFPSRLR
ncbi:hypothetical protein [Dactylosporangium sp. CA-092794]|uniref:hypothetical protein n=1 Tax=Dactylosporangium sp. CA-092794 TaxID=3239929 RepID=UPI003D8FF2E4